MSIKWHGHLQDFVRGPARPGSRRRGLQGIVIATAHDEGEAYSALKRIKLRAKRERKQRHEQEQRSKITLPKFNLPD